jgi:hypothetical protein
MGQRIPGVGYATKGSRCLPGKRFEGLIGDRKGSVQYSNQRSMADLFRNLASESADGLVGVKASSRPSGIPAKRKTPSEEIQPSRSHSFQSDRDILTSSFGGETSARRNLVSHAQLFGNAAKSRVSRPNE